MYDGEVHQAKTVKHEKDPSTYEEAMKDIDAKLWKNAMNSELDSMKSNNV